MGNEAPVKAAETCSVAAAGDADDGAVAVDAVADGTDADIVGRSVRGALHRKQNLLAASFGVPQLGQFF